MSDQTTIIPRIVLELFQVAVESPLHPGESEVEGMDLKMRAGEFWVISGVSNNAKSSILPTLAGLQKPLSGLSLLLGQNFQELSDQEMIVERRRIGTVFQGGGKMLKGLTVWENISLPIQYHLELSWADAAPKGMQIIEKAGLKAFASRLPSDFPASWQQRVGLARALALEPEIVLIDRPLGTLEFRHWNWWLKFLTRLQHGEIWGKTCSVIVTTDDPAPWADYATHFAAVEGKAFRVFATKQEALKSPQALADEISPEDFMGDF